MVNILFVNALYNHPMRKYTPEEWLQLAEQISDLLLTHIEQLKSQEKDDFSYLKIASGYQFFRMIRGEAFLDRRDGDVSKYQKQLYEMEKAILDKIEELDTSTIDPEKLKKIKEVFWL